MIAAAFFDIDGVLTDGAVYIDCHGNESKRIFYDDIDAIFQLKRAGIKIGFITGEDNRFAEYVKGRFSPDFFECGCKDKLGYFIALAKEQQLDRERVCFVGDSTKDVKLLEYVGFGFVPSDVDEDVKKHARFCVDAKRGSGVIREVAKFIVRENVEQIDCRIAREQD